MKKFIKFGLVTLLAITSAILIIVLFFRKDENSVVVRDYPEIKKSGYLNVAMDYNPLSYTYASNEDSVSGFYYDIVQAFADYSHLKVNFFLESNIQKSLEGLNDGKYDIVARGIASTVELKKDYLLTHPIRKEKLVLVQRKNDSTTAVHSVIELGKKKITVPPESPFLLRLKNLSEEIGDSIRVEEMSPYDEEQLIILVSSGKIDYTIAEKKFAQKIAKKLNNIDIDVDLSVLNVEAWCVRKDSKILLDSLNAWLSQFIKSKEYKLIEKKYY